MVAWTANVEQVVILNMDKHGFLKGHGHHAHACAPLPYPSSTRRTVIDWRGK